VSIRTSSPTESSATVDQPATSATAATPASVAPAVVAPSDRTLVEVTGADRTTYLEAVTSQALADAKPFEVRGAFHLDVHGAPLHAFDVLVHPERFWLLVPTRALAEDVVTVLGGRTFLSDATFRIAEGLTVSSLRGADALGLAAEAGLAVAPGRWDSDDALVRVGRPGGLDLVGPADEVEEAVAALEASGAVRGDDADLDDARIRVGEPAWGHELVAPHLPEELGLLPTHVHLAKGCYPGQEAVARMWQLGRPRRRLVVVDADPPVAAGAELGEGRRRVTVTSATRDGGVALAFAPGDTEVGTSFTGDDGRTFTVTGVVGDGLPQPGADPNVTRRRDARVS
jgi:tRNA-modifying protein YgfZ